MSHRNMYQMNGYQSREHYLVWLAKEYRLSIFTVKDKASLLGEEEDFDGLPSVLGTLPKDY